jgi:hypothetical protein
MPLLIDGNNVLCTNMPPGLAGLDEWGPCRLVAASGLGGGQATMVCDGPARGRGDPSAAANGMEIIYAGPGRPADPIILALIQRDTAPRRLIVVSSDHEIQRAAHRRRAQAWDSPRFIHELSAALAAARLHRVRGTPDTPKIQPGTLSEHDARRWAREFGLDPDQEVDPEAEL